MVLWKLGFREVRRRPGRSLLTLLSIVIGVSAVVSITIATGTTQHAYREMFSAVTGRAAFEVAGDGGASVDEAVVRQVQQMPGVKAAVPLVQRPAIMYVKDRRVQLAVMGVDAAKDAEVRDYVVAEGRFFSRGKGALIEVNFARSIGVKLHDEVKLLTRAGMQRMPVVGLLRSRGASSFYLGGMVLVPLPEAQRFFASRGRVDSIQVVLNEGTDADAALADIRKQLPRGIHAERPPSQTHLIEQTLLPSEQGLQLATGFSLLLATFIILNTFLMSVAERRRSLAMLRAIGATSRQVTHLLLGESLILGICGTALGIVVGLGFARLLTSALEQLLLTSLPSMHITATPFILAVVFGLGISLLGAWLPARRAARLTPIEGIDGVVREDIESTSHRFTYAGLALTVLAGGVIGLAIAGKLPMQAAITGSVFFLVGIVLMVPAVMDGLVYVLMNLLAARMPVPVRLASRQIPRHHSRSALTVSVLFIAISTGIGIACTILDNMANVQDWYRKALAGDFFIRAMMPDMATGLSADLPEGVGREIEKVPGITSIDGVRFVKATAAGQQVIAIVRQFNSDALGCFDLKSGDPAKIRQQLLAGEVVVSTVLAQRVGLKTGDMIPIQTVKGVREFRIAGLTNEYLVGGLAIFLERQTAKRWLGVEGVDGYVIQARHASLAKVQTDLQRICDHYGVLLHSFADISRLIDGTMTQIDGCLWGILVLGFVVAAFGVVNTLTMNVLEQTREFGLLRVVAMTRNQVRRTVLAQAVILGAAGLVPGALGGIGVAYLINLATLPAIGHPVEFGLHPEILIGSFVLAFAMVLAAALLPAERAARLKLTLALQYE